MRVRKSALRECARLALEQRGFRVEPIVGPGVVPGSRLRAIKGSEVHDIAVRSSTDGEIGLARRPDGGWSTLPRVDEVIVVAGAKKSGLAEVLSFAPDALMRVFDVALEARQKEKRDLSLKAPVFVALDDFVARDAPTRERRQDVEAGVKVRPQWRVFVPLADVPPQRLSPTTTAVGFIERVRQEFADLHGIDVSKVTVEFRIKS
jgi:hypothetical protein